MNELYEKIRQLNHDAWSGRNKGLQESLALAKQVESMLESCSELDTRELVLCLRTQGYCLEQLSRYTEALTCAMKAMELANLLGDRNIVASIDNVLGNIYWRLSDYSSSLDHFMHGLRLIQIEPDAETEVFLLQGLGALHHDMGDYEEALKYFKRSIEPVLTEDTIGRAFGLNNIAYTLHEMKRDAEALPHALQALELFGKNAFSVGKLETLHTLGSIYLEMGDVDQASKHFQEGLQTARYHENHLQTINCLFGLCEIQQMHGEWKASLDNLLLILQIAKEIGSLGSRCRVHEMLAKVYKQIGEYQIALEHYELFHSIHVRIFNEQAERRLRNTHVLLEVETMRKQTNLYRNLAATDSLTGLLSRREFFELGDKILHQVRTRRAPVSLLMVDLDYFKSVNDQYGHTVGDQVLAVIATRLKNTLRQDDLAGRYGGDEFVILMPDIGLAACQKIAERCQKGVTDQAVQIESLQLWMKISVGLAVVEGAHSVQLEDLIQQADQALLLAKKQGRNRIMSSASI
jgi:two-component system, cell cycle response regulator